MKELTSLFETYKNAVFQKDVEAFTALFDEKVRVFDMWVLWTYDGLAVWRDMAKDWFSSQPMIRQFCLNLQNSIQTMSS